MWVLREGDFKDTVMQFDKSVTTHEKFIFREIST